MTAWKRITLVVQVLVQLFRVIILLADPVHGKTVVIGTFQVQLVFAGLRYLFFYFTMARHMVDGRAILYRGGILLDLGIFLGFIQVTPSAWVMLYLVGYFILNCIYRCLKMLDTRKIQGDRWLRTAAAALWYLVLAVIGIVHLRSASVMVYLFCVETVLWMLHTLSIAFRKTAIAYIQ